MLEKKLPSPHYPHSSHSAKVSRRCKNSTIIYSTCDSSTLSMFVHVCAQWFIVLDRFVKVTACQSIQDICKAQMAIRQIFPRSEKCLEFAVQLNYAKLCFTVFYLFAAVCIWYKGDRITYTYYHVMHCSPSRHSSYDYIVYTKYNHAYDIPYTIVCLVLDIFAASLDLFQALNPSIRAEAPEGNHAALDADFRDAGENACGTGANPIQSLGSAGLGVKWLLETATCFSCMTSDMWQPCSHMRPFRSLMLS